MMSSDLHQDKRDDPAAGVKSTAQVLGDNAKPFLYMLEAVFIISLIYVGGLCDSGPLYIIGAVGAATTHVFWQVTVVDLEDPTSCFKVFYSNSLIGWPIWIPMLGDYYFKVYFARS
jgi:4-hydroxybenzoate polyprenyltransferase